MIYRILPPSLQQIADMAVEYAKANLGATRIAAEVEIEPVIEWRPTISGILVDKYRVCIEVTDSVISPTVKAAVGEIVQRQLPIKMYVAMPNYVSAEVFRENQTYARNRGIGLITVNGKACECADNPLALSLSAVRPIELMQYPKWARESLRLAETTYRGGNPAKGCAELYDELERYSRRICAVTLEKKLWNLAGTNPPNQRDIETGSWANLMDELSRHYDYKQGRTLIPGFTTALIGRLVSIPPERNQSGHKPKNVEERVRRDIQLRTRFESTADLLRELYAVTIPLKIRY